MPEISKSVGVGGANQRTDVTTVQNLLIKSARYLGTSKPYAATGVVDAITTAAIFRFQRVVVGMKNPDGRIDPKGGTLKLLNEVATGKNPVPIPPPGARDAEESAVTVPPAPPAYTGPAEPKKHNDCPFAEMPMLYRWFAPLYWPIRTKNSEGRQVCYQDIHDKHHGNRSRRFLWPRKGGTRYHCGVDLYGNHKDMIVAVESGTIINYYPFYLGTHCLFIQGDSGIVINYGEVEAGSWSEFKLRKGDRVKAGDPIARVGKMTKSSMCHFETYTAGTKSNQRWKTGQSRPNGLLDPTKLLLLVAKEGL